MVGFGKGLGCGCCGGCPSPCEIDENDNAYNFPPQPFVPSAYWPITEPFNNSGPTNPAIFALRSESSLTWNSATVNNCLNPNVYITSPAFFDKTIYSEGRAFAFTGQQCSYAYTHFDYVSQAQNRRVSLGYNYYCPVIISIHTLSTTGSTFLLSYIIISGNTISTFTKNVAVLRETFFVDTPTISGRLSIRLDELGDGVRITYKNNSQTWVDDVADHSLRCACGLWFNPIAGGIVGGLSSAHSSVTGYQQATGDDWFAERTLD